MLLRKGAMFHGDIDSWEKVRRKIIRKKKTLQQTKKMKESRIHLKIHENAISNHHHHKKKKKKKIEFD